MNVCQSQQPTVDPSSVIDFPDHGYSPKNYKALVNATKLSNVGFQAAFDIPNQTFYHHRNGTRTMNWEQWQSLVNDVMEFTVATS